MELQISFNNLGLRALVTILLCFEVSSAKTTRPKVTIPQGVLRGVTLKTRNDRSIHGFRGIPYAQAPIADLRFRAPVAADGWNGTFDAGSDGSPCIQSPNGVIFGSEDCLYINVYTPKLPKCNSKLLPVMVYIYGGQYLWGSNDYYTYNPTYLLDKDILLVIPNYRLGALGFLSTGDEVAPGNWGLKDQILALRWVQENIQYFGGDPNKVTLVGESAGSMSADILSLTNLTKGNWREISILSSISGEVVRGVARLIESVREQKFDVQYPRPSNARYAIVTDTRLLEFFAVGLFHRCIAQSGVASPMTMQSNPTRNALRLGDRLGCTTANTSTLIECLRNASAAEITASNSWLLEWEIFPAVTWGPVVEPNIEAAVITDKPLNLRRNGNIRNIRTMKGWNREDGFFVSGILYANTTKFEEVLKHFEERLPLMMNYHTALTDVAAVTRSLKSYYFNDDLTTNRTELLANLTLLAGDILARFPMYEAVQHKSSKNNPRYLYSFDYRGVLSFDFIFSGGVDFANIVSHADDLIYIFDLTNSSFFASVNRTMSHTDYNMVTEMVELWTSFIKTGVPYSAALGKASWPRYSTSDQYLRIGSGADPSLEIASSDFQDRIKFWENLSTML